MQFGMGDTSLSFRDQHCKHGGSCDPPDRGLTIGGHESAWLVDLAAGWIPEKTESLFKKLPLFMASTEMMVWQHLKTHGTSNKLIIGSNPSNQKSMICVETMI